MSGKGRKAGEKMGAYETYGGNDLARARVRLGLTQEAVALACGISVRTIRAHEKESHFDSRTARRVHALIRALLAELDGRQIKPANAVAPSD